MTSTTTVNIIRSNPIRTPEPSVTQDSESPAVPHPFSISISPMSNEGASGNRGVILHVHGSGRLKSTSKRRREEDRKADCYLQNSSYIDGRVRINGYLLPVFITRVFQLGGPEHRGYINEQRIIGGVLPDTCPPPKPIRTVPIVVRLHRTRDELTVLVQEPLWIEAASIGAIRRRVMVALPSINHATSPFGYEHAFIPIILSRGVWNT